MALFPKLAAKPHKGLSTCYGQLGCNGAPSRGGHQWVEPCPTIFPKSHFVTAGRGLGRGGGREPGEGTRRGDTNGHGHRGMQIPPWAFSGNKGPRGGRALHHCSLCSQHLLSVGRGVAAVPPHHSRRANGSTMAPLARVRPGFLPRPLPPALFTSTTISRSAREGGGFEARQEEEEGGNIGLWRKSLTPFPLLSLPLRPDGLQSHILKAKQKTKTQRLTCLKSMKANCSVSPWNPGTGPDLANSVGKKRG